MSSAKQRRSTNMPKLIVLPFCSNYYRRNDYAVGGVGEGGGGGVTI